MKATIKFRSEITIEGDSLDEIKEKWQSMILFSKDAIKNGAEFIDISSVEDADTNEDIEFE